MCFLYSEMNTCLSLCLFSEKEQNDAIASELRSSSHDPDSPQENAMATTSRGRCYLCAPLVASTVADMIRQMHLALEQGADLVELRLDFIVGFDPASHLPLLLSQKPLPALVTFRSVQLRRQWTTHSYGYGFFKCNEGFGF
jgi:hypothetical protein